MLDDELGEDWVVVRDGPQELADDYLDVFAPVDKFFPWVSI